MMLAPGHIVWVANSAQPAFIISAEDDPSDSKFCKCTIMYKRRIVMNRYLRKTLNIHTILAVYDDR